jgi:hypothetical protein
MSVVGDPFRASVQFGRQSFHQRDLEAYANRLGGEIVEVDEQKPAHEFGDPGPLGLAAFALTTSVLSLINIQARSVTDPNIAIGLGIHLCKF